jgi:hypothetical protein
MNKVSIEFSTDNADFRDEDGRLQRWRLGEILRDLAYDIGEGGRPEGSVWDGNGNRVGKWEVVETQ